MRMRLGWDEDEMRMRMRWGWDEDEMRMRWGWDEDEMRILDILVNICTVTKVYNYVCYYYCKIIYVVCIYKHINYI